MRKGTYKHSEETKEKLRLAMIGKYLSEEHKKNISLACKGRKAWNKGIKNYRKNYKHSEETKQKISLAKKGKHKKIKNIQHVVNTLKNVFKYDGRVLKTEFFNNQFVKNQLGQHHTIRRTLKNKGLTLDDIAILANVQFKTFRHGIGSNETQILDNIEKENNVKLERTFSIDKFYLDGYDPINNIAYEVDELHHKYQQVQDKIRENIIKEKLGCELVRIKDGW